MPAPFVCFRLLDSVLAPRMRYYRPRVRLMGRLLRIVFVDKLLDAYRFCESRGMELFRPDTKLKNMFLTKMSLAMEQPILIDMYRFGYRFEFQYG